MKIGLHDSDHTGFPNLALMKISAWHKQQGDDVKWWIPLEDFDRVYSSKVFTFSPVEPMLPENFVGGVLATESTTSCRRRLTPCSRTIRFIRTFATRLDSSRGAVSEAVRGASCRARKG